MKMSFSNTDLSNKEASQINKRSVSLITENEILDGLNAFTAHADEVASDQHFMDCELDSVCTSGLTFKGNL
jgi:hypothetical protein